MVQMNTSEMYLLVLETLCPFGTRGKQTRDLNRQKSPLVLAHAFPGPQKAACLASSLTSGRLKLKG